MKLKTKIKLESHDNTENYLVLADSQNIKYKLKTPYNYRVGFKGDSEEECTFIDPSGGPFISVGDVIDNLKVKTIYHNGIIEFEKNDIPSN